MISKNSEVDFDKIMIYPNDYDKRTKKKLLKELKKLGIRFEYEQYA